MKLIENITTVCKLLDEIEDYTKTLNGRQSECDLKLSDVEHYIENHKLVANERYHVCGKMKDILTERRIVKKDLELSRLYKCNIGKLNNKVNRQFLLSKLNELNKQLESPYKYRVCDEKFFSTKGGDE